MAGARDIIAHEYFGVRLDRIWDIVKKDIPLLKTLLSALTDVEDG